MMKGYQALLVSFLGLVQVTLDRQPRVGESLALNLRLGYSDCTKERTVIFNWYNQNETKEKLTFDLILTSIIIC